jgi:twitching motility protein PilI
MQDLAEPQSLEDQAPQAARLGVMIAGQRYLIGLADAGEIGPVPSGITPVPNTKAWLLGITNLRGVLYAISDLGAFFGAGPTPVSKESRLVSVSPRFGVHSAFLVERMLGLQAPRGWHKHQPMADMRLPFVYATWVDTQDRHWHELDLAGLLADSQFLKAYRG